MNTTPIEFMAWDKKSKKMRVVYNIIYDTYSENSKNPKINLVNMWGKIFPAYDDGECNTDVLVQRDPKYVELMQLTALRSINDEPIYNHMIVKNEFGDHFLVDMFNYPIMEFLTRFDLEIVGNRFQHPELLELCK
jgi:hypothetical protein